MKWGSVRSGGRRETGGWGGEAAVAFRRSGKRGRSGCQSRVGVGSVGRSGWGTSSSSVGRGENVVQVIGRQVVSRAAMEGKGDGRGFVSSSGGPGEIVLHVS